MRSLAESTVAGLSCNTNDKRSLPFHLIVASYVAYIPETEDFLSDNRGNQTPIPSHLCNTKRELSSKPFVATKRCLAKRNQLIDMTSSERLPEKDRNDLLEKLSTHVIEPILATFPFVGIHKTRDVYFILI